MKKHILHVHEGVKNYNCEQCGKSFSTMYRLKVHISCVHEGIRNYECEKCKYKNGKCCKMFLPIFLGRHS